MSENVFNASNNLDVQKLQNEINQQVRDAMSALDFSYDDYQFPLVSSTPLRYDDMNGLVYRTYTSNNTNPYYFDPSLLGTLDDAEIIALEEENDRLQTELENVKELLALAMSKDNLTERQLLILRQLNRMEDNKGWDLAFLSPSVVELLEKRAAKDFLEGGIKFYYDVE